MRMFDPNIPVDPVLKATLEGLREYTTGGTTMEINPLFSSANYSPEGLAKVDYVREAFSVLLDKLEVILPGGSREMSIIKTQLEQASFYAVKAVRNYEENLA